MRNKIFFLVCYIVMALGCVVCAHLVPNEISQTLYIIAAMMWSAAVGIETTNLFYRD